ncbi:MAG: hypothetical protein ACI8SR_002246 [Oceanicoccus sp.]
MVQVAHDATNSMDNPFWLYSIDQYQKPGCAEFLLHAQDHYGLDVNILLFIGWLNLNAKSYCPSALMQNVQRWQIEKVRPIRQLRRRANSLKHAGLYQALKDLELFAEKRQQKMLFDISLSWPVSDGTGFNEFKRSIKNYLAQTCVEEEESWLQVLYQHLQP